MYKFLLLFMVIVCFTGCGQTSNNQIKESIRDVGDFHKITVKGGFTLRVTASVDKQKVVLKMDSNLLPLVTTAVSNNTLTVTTKPGASLSSKNPLVVDIQVPSLTGISVDGGAKITANGIAASDFALDCNGSCNASLKGTTKKLILEVDGGGSVVTKDLIAQDAKIKISGSSNIKVQATKTLDIIIEGGGKITYFGSPKISQNISGSGTVRTGK